MIKNKVCPRCGSLNCEESTKNIPKQKAHLYPVGAKKVSCYLCYNCGASRITYDNH
jgi:predicted nucleic-acid-binding Zn-ribbon protein